MLAEVTADSSMGQRYLMTACFRMEAGKDRTAVFGDCQTQFTR
jgi:hypothetical protein